MKKFFKQGMHVLSVIICVMLMCPAESAVAADNLFAQMEADGVYQQYAALMDVSVQYQDEKKMVWEFIHTAVDLQRQALEGGMETPMPEYIKKMQVLNINEIEKVTENVDFVFSALNMSKNEIKVPLAEA